MLAVGIYIADVQLAQPSAEAFEDLQRYTHCGINLAHMPQVQAEGHLFCRTNFFLFLSSYKFDFHVIEGDRTTTLSDAKLVLKK